MTVAVFSHPDMISHRPGEGHPERPARLAAVMSALADSGLDTTGVDETVCCYAEKTETWVHAPDGNRWEWYVKNGDTEQLANIVVSSTSGASAGCCG